MISPEGKTNEGPGDVASGSGEETIKVMQVIEPGESVYGRIDAFKTVNMTNQSYKLLDGERVTIGVNDKYTLRNERSGLTKFLDGGGLGNKFPRLSKYNGPFRKTSPKIAPGRATEN
ncbi:MAG: hypothetical protein IPF63_14045 [Bacteroidetes bacterium]|nr:hypothetical protein [Bacteroidota bacterium]